MPVEGFRGHVATDGSLWEISGRWSACGWSVVQRDHDEEMRPKRGMYGTLDAYLEAQRTSKRAELTAFFCLVLITKGIIHGLWRREVCALAKNADLWILIWEEVRRVHEEGSLPEVEHVAADRSLMEKQGLLTLFERFVTEGNEKADELAADGAKMDGGDMAQVTAITVQQKKRRRFVPHCSMQLASTVWWRSGKIVKSSDQSRKEFCELTKGCKEASNGVLCGSKHISVYEMRKKQQTHENTTNM